jgi:hypothetical protein
MRYQPKPLPPQKRLLEAQIVKVSREHPTLGYKKVTALMRSKGYLANKKQVQRIRREEGLQVPPPRPRERRQGLSTGLAAAGHAPQSRLVLGLGLLWSCRTSCSVVADFTQRGGKLRVFNLIDEFTRVPRSKATTKRSAHAIASTPTAP